MNFDPMLSGLTAYRTPYGTLLPPMGRVVAYVRATALADDDANVANLRTPTIAAALSRVTAGRNDIIVVLPGHTENISTANAWSALRANTHIVGLGSGASKPTLTFTTTAAQLILAAAGVTIRGIQLNFGGGVDVVLGVDVTAADVSLIDCEVITAASSTSRATTVMRLSSGADRFTMANCFWRGTNGANSCVDGIIVNAAVTHLRMLGNFMSFGTTVTTVGNVRFATAAATEVLIARNVVANTTASSTACFDFDVAATGIFADNRLRILSNQAAGAGGFVGTSAAMFFENYVTGVVETSGYLAPTADA